MEPTIEELVDIFYDNAIKEDFTTFQEKILLAEDNPYNWRGEFIHQVCTKKPHLTKFNGTDKKKYAKYTIVSLPFVTISILKELPRCYLIRPWETEICIHHYTSTRHLVLLDYIGDYFEFEWHENQPEICTAVPCVSISIQIPIEQEIQYDIIDFRNKESQEFQSFNQDQYFQENTISQQKGICNLEKGEEKQVQNQLIDDHLNQSEIPNEHHNSNQLKTLSLPPALSKHQKSRRINQLKLKLHHSLTYQKEKPPEILSSTALTQLRKILRRRKKKKRRKLLIKISKFNLIINQFNLPTKIYKLLTPMIPLPQQQGDQIPPPVETSPELRIQLYDIMNASVPNDQENSLLQIQSQISQDLQELSNETASNINDLKQNLLNYSNMIQVLSPLNISFPSLEQIYLTLDATFMLLGTFDQFKKAVKFIAVNSLLSSIEQRLATQILNWNGSDNDFFFIQALFMCLFGVPMEQQSNLIHFIKRKQSDMVASRQLILDNSQLSIYQKTNISLTSEMFMNFSRMLARQSQNLTTLQTFAMAQEDYISIAYKCNELSHLFTFTTELNIPLRTQLLKYADQITQSIIEQCQIDFSQRPDVVRFKNNILGQFLRECGNSLAQPYEEDTQIRMIQEQVLLSKVEIQQQLLGVSNQLFIKYLSSQQDKIYQKRMNNLTLASLDVVYSHNTNLFGKINQQLVSATEMIKYDLNSLSTAIISSIDQVSQNQRKILEILEGKDSHQADIPQSSLLAKIREISDKISSMKGTILDNEKSRKNDTSILAQDILKEIEALKEKKMIQPEGDKQGNFRDTNDLIANLGLQSKEAINQLKKTYLFLQANLKTLKDNHQVATREIQEILKVSNSVDTIVKPIITEFLLQSSKSITDLKSTIRAQISSFSDDIYNSTLLLMIEKKNIIVDKIQRISPQENQIVQEFEKRIINQLNNNYQNILSHQKFQQTQHINFQDIGKGQETIPKEYFTKMENHIIEMKRIIREELDETRESILTSQDIIEEFTESEGFKLQLMDILKMSRKF